MGDGYGAFAKGGGRGHKRNNQTKILKTKNTLIMKKTAVFPPFRHFFAGEPFRANQKAVLLPNLGKNEKGT